MITDSVKEKIGMGWESLGHFHIAKEIVPPLDFFRAKVPSGRIAVITNDIISGPPQVSIIGLPSLFTPNDADFIQILASLAFFTFEFRFRDDKNSVSFQFIGTLGEYLDGVLHCRFSTHEMPFGGPFDCSDLMLKGKK